MNARIFSVKSPTDIVDPEKTIGSVAVGVAPFVVSRIVAAGSGLVIVSVVPGAYSPLVKLITGVAVVIV